MIRTYWRKKANVSREIDTSEAVSPLGFPLTKCGVAANLPPVSSSSASPVWNAIPSAQAEGRREQGTYLDNLVGWKLSMLAVLVDLKLGVGGYTGLPSLKAL